MGVYLGALGLLVLGALLFRNTSITEITGGTEYERRRMRRFIGATLMLMAFLCAGIEALSQSVGNEGMAASPAPESSGTDQRQIALGALPPPAQMQLSSAAPATNSQPVIATPTPPQEDPAIQLLREAFDLLSQKKSDAALEKANAAIQAAPRNPETYLMRGNVYVEKGLWDQAAKDYQTVLDIDGKNALAKFNLAEIDFKQKKYDQARAGFAALGQDSDIGDISTYKVFLCDLFGAHEDAAAKELDAFNQVGANASYYFANGAWSLYHHQTEEARGWLTSAARIYDPPKFKLYASTLLDLGYLPLPPPPPT